MVVEFILSQSTNPSLGSSVLRIHSWLLHFGEKFWSRIFFSPIILLSKIIASSSCTYKSRYRDWTINRFITFWAQLHTCVIHILHNATNFNSLNQSISFLLLLMMMMTTTWNKRFICSKITNELNPRLCELGAFNYLPKVTLCHIDGLCFSILLTLDALLSSFIIHLFLPIKKKKKDMRNWEISVVSGLTECRIWLLISLSLCAFVFWICG